MKFLTFIFIILLIYHQGIAQSSDQLSEWHGYSQFRIYKQDTTSEGFMIRRLKFWVKGHTPFAKDISYKVMGIFSYNKSGFFGLLDAYGDYQFDHGYLRFGQQIPEFSLQRDQPDWKIPVIERATVINRLIPAAQSLARDIGVQIHLQPTGVDNWQVAAGIFNGDGANLNRHNSQHFLYTIRNTLKTSISENYFWHVGGSVMYRYDDQADLWLIFGRDRVYTGSDFRFSFESQLKLKRFNIQSEYLEARFGNQKANGYYLLVDYNLSGKDQIILSGEQLNDLNDSTDDEPWFIAGYNHLFKEHFLKVMISGRTRFNHNYWLSTQVQLFFN